MCPQPVAKRRRGRTSFLHIPRHQVSNGLLDVRWDLVRKAFRGPSGGSLEASGGAGWGPHLCVLGALRGLLGPLGGLLGPPGGSLGRKARIADSWSPSWAPPGAILGPFLGCLEAVLCRLGALLGRCGALLGACWAVLGRSWGPLGPSSSVGSLKTREDQTRYKNNTWKSAMLASWGPLGKPLGGLLGSLGGILGRLKGILGRLGTIFRRFGPLLDRIGGLLGPSWPVVGPSAPP